MKLFVLAVALYSVACSKASSPAESASTAEHANSVCIEIAHSCHEYEGFSAKAKDCHVKGHSKATSEEQCQAMRAECLDECNKAAERARETDAGGTAEPGAPGHEHPAGTDPAHAH